MNSVEQKRIIVVIAILLIVLFVISVARKAVVHEEDLTEEQKVQLAEAKKEQAIIDDLAGMEERDRIEYYFSQFINSIESKNYQKAYDMLYDEYKANYFPNLTNFEEYAKKTFPKMISVKHINFERNGEIYILFIEISDSLSGNKTDSKEMKFIIREDELNGYIMSFSVI